MYGGEQGKILTSYKGKNSFQTTALLCNFGYLAMGMKPRKVWRGEYIPPPWTDQYRTQLFCFVKISEEMRVTKPVSTVLHTEDFIQGWKWAQEQTLSSPSRYHLGNAKAACRIQTLRQQQWTSHMHWKIPCSIGITKPTTWSKRCWEIGESITSALLYEVDFNLINKELGQDSVRKAKKYNLVSEEQYGSQRGGHHQVI